MLFEHERWGKRIALDWLGEWHWRWGKRIALDWLGECTGDEGRGMILDWLEDVLRSMPEYELGGKDCSELLPGNWVATHSTDAK